MISRATVLMVEALLLGSGGKGAHLLASDVVLAATMTICALGSVGVSSVHPEDSERLPTYLFLAKSTAICLPIPLLAPMTRAT